MENIIRVKDSSIDVSQIMKEISEKARGITLDEIMQDMNKINAFEFSGNSDSEISPYILTFIRKPQSKQSGFKAKISNLVIKKVYYVALNTLGEALAQQQQINKTLLNKISKLEKRLDTLEKIIAKKS